MRSNTKPVSGPVFSTKCRRCGCALDNHPHRNDIDQGFLFRTCRMYANPEDPPYTYVCKPCDEYLAAYRREED